MSTTKQGHNHTGTAEVAADDALTGVPGLGIVRVRALRKAGFGDLESLRAASQEQLTAVPGITEAVARRIIEFVGSGNLPTHAVVHAAPPAMEENTAEAAATAVAQATEQDHAALHRAARGLSDAAKTLLAVHAAVEFHDRMAHQIARVSALADACAHGEPPRGKALGKLTKRMQALTRRLTKAAARQHWSKKRQRAFAERVRTARRNLSRLAHAA